MVARGLFYFYGLSGEEVTSDNSSLNERFSGGHLIYTLIGMDAFSQ